MKLAILWWFLLFTSAITAISIWLLSTSPASAFDCLPGECNGTTLGGNVNVATTGSQIQAPIISFASNTQTPLTWYDPVTDRAMLLNVGTGLIVTTGLIAVPTLLYSSAASMKMSPVHERGIPQGGEVGMDEAFRQLREELSSIDFGKPIQYKARNTYPPFRKVSPDDPPRIAVEQAQRLEQQLGIRIPVDRILEAPWIGRIQTRRGDLSSASTAEGWERNESRFWTLFKETWPEDYTLVGPNHTITRQWVEKYGWDKSLIDNKLIHHHMENGPFVVAIPESLHQSLYGTIHAKYTKEKIPWQSDDEA